MLTFRPVLLVCGLLIVGLGLTMLAPMSADLLSPDPLVRADWGAFALSSIICLFVGGTFAGASWGPITSVSIRDGFLLTATSWLGLACFAALPLAFGNYDLTYTDAFFEAMSALTTTGSTVIAGLDDAPPGLLLWRSILQWIGGIGVIIMAFAVLPALKVGGMQIFKVEAWDTREKFVGSAAQYSIGLSGIYLFFTVLCAMLYWAFGMPAFDAVNHAMTTVATGGLSTRDASFGAFLATGNAPLDLIAVVFMIVGSMPFGIFLVALLRGQAVRLLTDSQIVFFLALLLSLILIMTVYVFARFNVDPFTAFRLAAFNVTSIMTGTGYSTTGYDTWGGFAVGFFFCICFIGGCAGSTSCGLKIFRLQVALAALRMYGRKLAHPNGVFVAKYNGRPLDQEVFVSVLSFVFIYFASFATLAVLLSGHGLDPLTSISGAAAAITNVGPGLGPVIGPAGNFSSLADSAKWLLSIGMLMGRLEFFTVLVLFSPSFWRG